MRVWDLIHEFPEKDQSNKVKVARSQDESEEPLRAIQEGKEVEEKDLGSKAQKRDHCHKPLARTDIPICPPIIKGVDLSHKPILPSKDKKIKSLQDKKDDRLEWCFVEEIPPFVSPARRIPPGQNSVIHIMIIKIGTLK